MASKSPTARTLEYYRDLGWTIEVTERWCQFSRKRKDTFGFGDLLAFDGQDTYLIQATSTGNVPARVKKILESPVAPLWVAGPCRRILVIGWKKYAKAVDRKFYRPTIREVMREDFGQRGDS